MKSVLSLLHCPLSRHQTQTPDLQRVAKQTSKQNPLRFYALCENHFAARCSPCGCHCSHIESLLSEDSQRPPHLDNNMSKPVYCLDQFCEQLQLTGKRKWLGCAGAHQEKKCCPANVHSQWTFSTNCLMKWSEPPLRWIFSTLHAQYAAHLPLTTLLSSSPAMTKTFQQINFTHSLLFGVFTKVILASNKTEGAVDWIQTVHLWDCCSGLWAQKLVGTSHSRWCHASSFTCMYPWMGCGQSMEARMHREIFRVWFLQTLIDCLLKIDNNPSNKNYTRHGNLQTPTRCLWRRASTLTVDTNLVEKISKIQPMGFAISLIHMYVFMLHFSTTVASLNLQW